MSETKDTQSILAPSGISPAILIRSYSDDDWEVFIQEWTKGFEKQYKFVERLGGAGDKGRDVVAYITDPNAPAPEWDNYQCKHYKTPVQPSHMWSDFGKLCYYCWKKDYSPPKIYRIVAPLEVSPSFKELLKNPAAIREGLKINWGSHCERGGITTTADVPLDGDLASYVESFDFSIIGYVPLVDILEQHAKTPFWDIRFKELPPRRPPFTLPPQPPSSLESRYLQQLLEAYSDHEKTALNTVEEIRIFQNHFRHYERSREDFYKAESLYRFTKDFVALGSFEEFKKQILDGVIDICDSDFDSALNRLKATTQEAAMLPPCPGHLGNLATIGDKKGSCHHLANEDKLIWKQ